MADLTSLARGRPKSCERENKQGCGMRKARRVGGARGAGCVGMRAVWHRLVRGPGPDLGARWLGQSGRASSELVAVGSGVNSG